MWHSIRLWAIDVQKGKKIVRHGLLGGTTRHDLPSWCLRQICCWSWRRRCLILPYARYALVRRTWSGLGMLLCFQSTEQLVELIEVRHIERVSPLKRRVALRGRLHAYELRSPIRRLYKLNAAREDVVIVLNVVVDDQSLSMTLRTKL